MYSKSWQLFEYDIEFAAVMGEYQKSYFVAITYGHYSVINTEFHKFQDSNSIAYDLHYDITKQKNNKKDNQI